MKSKNVISKNDLEKAILVSNRISDIAAYLNLSEWQTTKLIKDHGIIRPRTYHISEHSATVRKANGLKHRGDNNPSKRTDVRKKISDKKKEYWDQFSSEERSQILKSIVTESTIEKVSAAKKEWWNSRTPEQLKEISEKFSKAQALNQSVPFSKHKSGWHYSIKGGDFHYRSSWELIIAGFLDDNPLVICYMYESRVCRYHDYTIDAYRWFRPDFVVTMASGKRILLEVKPGSLIQHNIVKLIGQWEWALNESIEYRIVSEDLVRDLAAFNQLLEEVNDGRYRSDTPERCGFVGVRISPPRS